MICDPSDGSVREKAIEELDRHIGGQAPASGLPTASTKPENVARLEKSREWLREYRKPKTEGQ